MVTYSRPSISLSILVALPALATTEGGEDVSVLVNAVKVAVMNYVNNDVAPDAALTIVGVNGAASGVYGVDSVRPRTLLDGDVLDLPAAAGGFYVDAANEIQVEVVIVE